MKKTQLTSFILVLSTLSSFGQLSSFFVKPYQTDTAYTVLQDSNLVVINQAVTPLGKLLFYIGGTNSSPRRTTYFLNLAANLGFHVISVAYPNTPSIQTACGSSSDTNCYYNFRQEVCYGTPLSSSVTVDTLNCLNTRAAKLIQYLNSTYPAQNWGQFISSGQLVWNKVVTAGHSQGGWSCPIFLKNKTN